MTLSAFKDAMNLSAMEDIVSFLAIEDAITLLAFECNDPLDKWMWWPSRRLKITWSSWRLECNGPLGGWKWPSRQIKVMTLLTIEDAMAFLVLECNDPLSGLNAMTLLTFEDDGPLGGSHYRVWYQINLWIFFKCNLMSSKMLVHIESGAFVCYYF